MNRKPVLLAAVTILGLGLALPTFAGERTGNGGFNPIGMKIVVAAICSFSGLEDFDGGPVDPGTTQTPHSEGENTFPAGVAAICQYLNPGKNPKPMPEPPAP